MAWFWQKKQREQEQRSAQKEAVDTKRSMFKRASKDTGKESKAAVKTKKEATNKISKPFAGYGVLLGPVVTEKAARLAEHGTFVFAVTQTANKIQVSRAVASLYDVHPTSVTILNGTRKPKMFGQVAGRRSAQRKAYVTLAKGEHIEFFEQEKSSAN